VDLNTWKILHRLTENIEEHIPGVTQGGDPVLRRTQNRGIIHGSEQNVMSAGLRVIVLPLSATAEFL
jgi:hypothetical protein